MSFSILGTGSAFGSRVITNGDFENMLDTSDEWIRTRTGIRERHTLAEGESLTQLACKAASGALEMAGLTPQDLDYIICATVTADYKTPAQACVIQKELGATCPAFDINAGCSGFVYALNVANGFFAVNPDIKVLVIGADAITRLMDWNDRSTAVLFGDASGAVVLGKGNGLKALTIKAKGNTDYLYCINEKDEYVHMAGQKVFQFAVSSMVRDIKKVVKDAGITFDDVDHILLHQANMRIIDFGIEKLGIPPEKFPVNIYKTGNTSAASIPALLDETVRSGAFKKGEMVVMSAFGAGLTSGAAVIEWEI